MGLLCRLRTSLLMRRLLRRQFRSVCGAEVLVAPHARRRLVLAYGQLADPADIAGSARCVLQRNHTGPHVSLLWELDRWAGADQEGEVWGHWNGDGELHFSIRADCPARNGPLGRSDGACTLFSGHPGEHSFRLWDVRYEGFVGSDDHQTVCAALDENHPSLAPWGRR